MVHEGSGHFQRLIKQYLPQMRSVFLLLGAVGRAKR
jgi:hypothetical protein